MTNNERKAMADYKIHIPSNRLYEIFEMIKALPTENKYQKQRKEILEMVFIDGINPSAICKKECFYSNQGKPMSVRRIQQIVLEYVPDYFECRRKPMTQKKKLRTEETAIKKQILQYSPRKCAKCGKETDKLAIDHILPVCIGGDNSPENLQLLCTECHKIKTDYERKILNWGKRGDE